jgi:hypothetical protein
MSDNALAGTESTYTDGRPMFMVFGKDMSAEAIAAAIQAESRRQIAGRAKAPSVASTALVAGVGELDVCALCDSSPHVMGCPHDGRFENERFSYVRVDDPNEVGPASFWVRDTFVEAALEAGIDERAAWKEGVAEFTAALSRGELKPRTN